MTANLDRAYREWVTRPADERFSSLEDLYEFTDSRRINSFQRVKPLDSLQLDYTPQGGLILNGNSQPAYLSHWAFGQLCSRVSAPAKYLRTLPPEMVRDCLQHGLHSSDQSCKLLVRNSHANGLAGPDRHASAFTGPSYGRIWDSDVVESLMRSVEGSGWHIPRSSHSTDNRGLYASDRDMFAFMINEENPIEVGNAKLSRGFFLWNSETGSATFGLTTFLYNHMCDNHLIYGAEQIKDLRIFHRKYAVDNFQKTAIPTLNRFIKNSKFQDNVKDTIAHAMKSKIANTLEDTIKWFKNKPFTKKEITSAWENGLVSGEDVTTRWGLIQGLTSYAQSIPYMDKKVNLERRAGAMLNSNT